MSTSLVWFRQDLRISDNLSLNWAAENQLEIIPLYILDESDGFEIGSASKWFLHHALASLKNDLKEKYDLDLLFFKGDSSKIISQLVEQNNVQNVLWNRVYEPSFIKRDSEIKSELKSKNILVKSFNSSLLFEAGDIKNGSGQYFKVYTPFWKNCLANSSKILDLVKSPKSMQIYDFKGNTVSLSDLNLLPTKPNWAKGWDKIWDISEESAHNILDEFLDNKAKDYSDKRDLPSVQGTSKLSAHIHYGLISARQIFHKSNIVIRNGNSGAEKFLSQIGWREFSYNLLLNFSKLASKNFNSNFDKFEWQYDNNLLIKWQKGKTGYPLVDAGMRELWHTGWMHNRVRMVVASFLIKNLLIDWRYGLKWFDDCLIDQNLANNASSWQWVAGSGADAAPYFRVFNVVLQSKKFDGSGEYIRKWIPELSKLSDKDIHEPFNLNEEKLFEAGINLGKDYPKPIVDIYKSRDIALALYKKLS